MKKTVTILIIISILSKILGLGRELVLSYFYGATSISDIYIISLTIPVSILGFIATGISTGYIPMYSSIEEERGLLDANKYTSNLVNILMIICTILIILGLVFTNELVWIFASGFEGETFKLAVKFTRISLFGMYFIGLMSIFSSFLQIKGNYSMPALVGLPLNIIVILSIFISSKTNIYIIAFGSLLATISQFIFLIPFIKKQGYKHNKFINIKDEDIKRMFYISIPVILGASVNQINTLIDKTLASSIAEGGISALNYAGKLSDSILTLFVSTIATVIYPNMSKMVARNNIEGLKNTVEKAINIVNILIIPASIGMMIFSKEIVNILFGRGAFTEKALMMTTGVFFYYTMGNIGYGLRQILYRVFYSLQDTKTPMINASISVVINSVLNVILSRYFGLNGLALATSLSAIFCLILLFVNMSKKIGYFGLKGIILTFLKVFIASIIMGIIARSTFNHLGLITNSKLALALSISISALIYFILIYIFKVDEINIFTKKIKDIIYKQKNK